MKPQFPARISRLFIAEKPSLGRAIVDVLGVVRGGSTEGYFSCKNGDVVTWAYGHLFELANPDAYDPKLKKWDLNDLPISVNNWILEKKKQKNSSIPIPQISVIEELLKVADCVVHAGDPDREGQLLIDEILTFFSFSGNQYRLLLNATDEKTVKKALASIRPNSQFRNLSISAECRRQADWLVGLNMTRALTIKFPNANREVMTVGRVQTPTLALVVRRDREIENFVVENFYTIKATVSFNHKIIDFFYDPNPHLFDNEVAKKIAAFIKNRKYKISVISEQKQELASLPFDLATFQQSAENAYKWTATDSLKILQSLYEKKLTSYPRTDCRYLPNEQAGDALTIMANLLPQVSFEMGMSPQLVGWVSATAKPSPRIYDSKKVEEHHGIVPTGQIPSQNLSVKEKQAFILVCRQFFEGLLPDFSYQETVMTFAAQVVGVPFSPVIFKAKGVQPINLESSWKALRELQKNDRNKSSLKKQELIVLPNWSDQTVVNVEDAVIRKGKTTPPKFYTEASLIADMRGASKFLQDPRLQEKLKQTKGIGTSATQADIIDRLKTRGFIEPEKNSIRSTDLGRRLIDLCPPSLSDPGLTAVWETALDQIAKGTYSPEAFMAKINHLVAKRVLDVKNSTEVSDVSS